MILELKKPVPLPMREIAFSEESIWKMDTIINSSEDYLILAPSGTGKSSLFAFLAGLRKDFDGDILLDGHSLKEISLDIWSEIRKQRMALVAQDLRLLPQISVGENLLVKNQLTDHYSEKEIRILLERVGLGDKWNQEAGTLSLGQQQRVAIIRALLQPMEIIVLDEPFSHLDKTNTHILLDLIIEEKQKQGAGMVVFSLGEHYGLETIKKLYL